MASQGRNSDAHVRQIRQLLEDRYGSRHPKATISVYRYNSGSIRVRVIDPEFSGKGPVEREEAVWPLLETLPPEVREEITILLLISPKERKVSLLSREFDRPRRSRL